MPSFSFSKKSKAVKIVFRFSSLGWSRPVGLWGEVDVPRNHIGGTTAAHRHNIPRSQTTIQVVCLCGCHQDSREFSSESQNLLWSIVIFLNLMCSFIKDQQKPGLHNLYQPASRAVRKWRENEKMKRKWRENEEMERDLLSTFPHYLFISSLSIHFLYQKSSHFVAKC